jgi:hypothetical protein
MEEDVGVGQAPLLELDHVHVSNGPAQHLLLDQVIKELLQLEIENPM